MRPICFPKMFNTNTTRVWKASEHLASTRQNCTTLLHCKRGELFSDPYFGLTLKTYLFDQNNEILEDAIIDVIYTQLVLFIPQIKLDRKNIRIIRDRELGKLYCEFDAIDQIDFKVNTYQLLLFQNNTTE